MTVAEAGLLDQAAREAGLTRAEFLRSRVFGLSPTGTAQIIDGPATPRPLAEQARPALPDAAASAQ